MTNFVTEQIAGLDVRGVSTSAGQFLEIQQEAWVPWETNPEDPPLVATAHLDRGDVERLRELLDDYLGEGR